ADHPLVLGAELRPQPPDVHVDGAGAAEEVVAPHLLQQLGAREDPTRVLREGLEQLELLVGQLEQPTARPRRGGRLADDVVAGPSFARSRRTCTSTVRVPPKKS